MPRPRVPWTPPTASPPAGADRLLAVAFRIVVHVRERHRLRRQAGRVDGEDGVPASGRCGPLADSSAADGSSATTTVPSRLLRHARCYALRRTRSRFAAHHAVRALLVQLAAITVSVVGSLVVLFTSLALVLIDPQALLFGLLLYGALMAGLLVYLVIVVIAAVQALHGQVVRDSRLGRATEWLLAQDVGVPADDG
jgi:hypothetical protein